MENRKINNDERRRVREMFLLSSAAFCWSAVNAGGFIASLIGLDWSANHSAPLKERLSSSAEEYRKAQIFSFLRFFTFSRFELL